MHKSLFTSLSLSILFFTFVVSGCKKTETDYISRIKNYPAITLNGPTVASINVGETYTDPGATTLLDGKTVTTAVSGVIDNTTPGFYAITYRGANTEGDVVSTSRLIAVVPASVNNLDQSGTFVRASNGVATKVTKVSKGLYVTNNFGGVAPPSGAIQSAYFAQVSPNSLVFPTQDVPTLGSVAFTGLTSAFNSAGILTSYEYAVANSNFGTAPRTFNRQ